jgi:thiol-disulfide isomerase/thioredoxin
MEVKMKKVIVLSLASAVLVFGFIGSTEVFGASKKGEVPEKIKELFGSKLKNAKNKGVPVSDLSGKIIGVYFSAHWCPPCRAFTPKLVEFYNELKKADKNFQIVFVSSDQSKKDMYGYMKEMKMPWLALPFGDKHKASLGKTFNVKGIPTLIILAPDGSVISMTGRSDVYNGVKAFDEWEKKAKEPESKK